MLTFFTIADDVATNNDNTNVRFGTLRKALNNQPLIHGYACFRIRRKADAASVRGGGCRFVVRGGADLGGSIFHH